MVVAPLGISREVQCSQIWERQLEGIQLAKLKGVYKGGVTGTKEDIWDFLSKEKNKKALDYLKKGYKPSEVVKLTDLNKNTVTKIIKLGINQSNQLSF